MAELFTQETSLKLGYENSEQHDKLVADVTSRIIGLLRSYHQTSMHQSGDAILSKYDIFMNSHAAFFTMKAPYAFSSSANHDWPSAESILRDSLAIMSREDVQKFVRTFERIDSAVEV